MKKCDYSANPIDTPFLTSRAAAAYLNVSLGSLYLRLRHKQLKAYRLGKLLRFRKEDLDACLTGPCTGALASGQAAEATTLEAIEAGW